MMDTIKMPKRLLDILLSLLALTAFLPFGLIIAVILRFSGEGEIFYRQDRVGRNGPIFGLIKFATMLKDSPNLGPGDITVQNDPRVLPFGRLLRKSKLNEVPQLINILRGDMSIVGPRPQTPRYFALFPDHVQKGIVHVRPGLTGVGSIVFRDEESMAAASGMDQIDFHRHIIAPYKGALELWYCKHQSLWLDIKLIVLTAWLVLRPQSRLYEFWFSDLPKAPGELRAARS